MAGELRPYLRGTRRDLIVHRTLASPRSLPHDRAHMISIGEPTLEHRDGRSYLTARIDGTPRAESLWYSVPAEYGEGLSPTGSDAFVLAVLPLAMAVGSDIVVRGSLSERLAYNLPRHYMSILSRFVPRLRQVSISADRVEPRCLPDGRGVATGISGGIDSFATIADHYLDDIQPGYRLTHLLFHNVGSHGRSAAGDRIFLRRRRHLSALADELRLPLIPVDSEPPLRPAPPVCPHPHTLRSVSVAHALAALISRFLYSASIEYRDVTMKPMRDISNVDPIAVPLLATEVTDCMLPAASTRGSPRPNAWLASSCPTATSTSVWQPRTQWPRTGGTAPDAGSAPGRC